MGEYGCLAARPEIGVSLAAALDAGEQSVYKELLTYLSSLREEKNAWIPTS